MKPVLLIAWREFRQYVFSRGFFLFLVLMPVGVIAVAAMLGFAERAQPVRAFVAYDASGRYQQALEAEFERRRLRDVVTSFDAYVRAAVEPAALEENRIPAPFAPGPADTARPNAFFAAGIDAARAAVAPHLRKGAPAFEPPRWPFRLLTPPPEVAAAASLDEARERLKPYLLGEKTASGADGPLFAAILIPPDFGVGGDAPAEFWSRNVTDLALKETMSRALNTALRREAAEARGLAAGAYEEVAGIKAPIEDYRPDRGAEDEAIDQRDRFESTLPALMTYVLLMVIFAAGQLLLTNTIEERSNKIVEILLSSVTAGQLMMGKLIGVAAVGLTMPTIFAIVSLVAAIGLGGGEETLRALATLGESGLVFVYLFYFFCAYAIFAMIFLAIGAVSNSMQDAQSFQGPIMMLVLLPIPFAPFVYHNPNGIIGSIFTWIPLYTPYAVMMRAASDPPLWEIAGATALMLVFAFVLARAMGRIFRDTILNPAPARAGEVWRLIRGGF
ncbi:MAG: ABC transporter permease [Parvularculaceae bacterium]|nr:ABC transporter permease [Parvularculaceae bacterium]